MTQTTHPSKQKLQDYLAKRHSAKVPPPPLEQVRRELGWGLIPKPR